MKKRMEGRLILPVVLPLLAFCQACLPSPAVFTVQDSKVPVLLGRVDRIGGQPVEVDGKPFTATSKMLYTYDEYTTGAVSSRHESRDEDSRRKISGDIWDATAGVEDPDVFVRSIRASTFAIVVYGATGSTQIPASSGASVDVRASNTIRMRAVCQAAPDGGAP